MRLRTATKLNLKPQTRMALEALSIDLDCSMVQAVERLLALPHSQLVALCREPAAPARPEASTEQRPADLYEAHINTHVFKAPTYDGVQFTNCDRCGEQYGARYTRLCPVVVSEPPGNTGPECTDTTRNPSGFCARCGLAH